MTEVEISCHITVTGCPIEALCVPLSMLHHSTVTATLLSTLDPTSYIVNSHCHLTLHYHITVNLTLELDATSRRYHHLDTAPRQYYLLPPDAMLYRNSINQKMRSLFQMSLDDFYTYRPPDPELYRTGPLTVGYIGLRLFISDGVTQS